MGHSPPVILIVDDDSSQRAYLNEILNKDTQYAILEAADGLSAVQLISKKHVSLIITDLFMPRMNGLEFVYFVQTLPSPPPIIMMSSLAGTKEQSKAKQLGVLHFFKKSNNLAPLIDAVKQITAK